MLTGDPELDAPKLRAGRRCVFRDAMPADPQLPPKHADFIDAALDDLPGRASQARLDHCASAAHSEWSDWRAAAEEWADRVTGPAAPVQSVVAEPIAAPPASVRRAGATDFAPNPVRGVNQCDWQCASGRVELRANQWLRSSNLLADRVSARPI